MWDLIVSVPDHCLSFYFILQHMFLDCNWIYKHFVDTNSNVLRKKWLPHFLLRKYKQKDNV